MYKPKNKSAEYKSIKIKVISINVTELTVEYSLFYALDSRRYTWKARSDLSLNTMSGLQPGRSYVIDVATDQRGVQHWSKATDIVIHNKPSRMTKPKPHNPIDDFISYD